MTGTTRTARAPRAARRATYRSFRAVLAQRRTLSENYVRLTFAHPDLADFGATGLDQRFKLVFLPEDQVASALAAENWADWWRSQPDETRPQMRTYTVREARPDACEVDVDVVCHGTDGPASRFALTGALGSELVLVGPDATAPGHDEAGVAFRPGAAKEFLLIGDETALPAVANILASLPADAEGAAFLEVVSAGDIRELPHPSGVELVWLPRSGDRGRGELLCASVFDWVDARAEAGAGERTPPPAGHGAGFDEDDAYTADGVLWSEAEAPGAEAGLCTWAAADADTVRTLRRGLIRDRGLPRADCSFMGYWRLGSAEGE